MRGKRRNALQVEPLDGDGVRTDLKEDEEQRKGSEGPHVTPRDRAPARCSGWWPGEGERRTKWGVWSADWPKKDAVVSKIPIGASADSRRYHRPPRERALAQKRYR